MFCQNCGHNVPDNAVFCDSCGARIEHSSQQTAPAQQAAQIPQNAPVQQAAFQPNGAAVKQKPRKGRAVLILVIVLAVVAIGAAAALILFLPKGGAGSGAPASLIVSDVAVYNGKVIEDSEDINYLYTASLSGDCFVTNNGQFVIKDGKMYEAKMGGILGFGFSVAACGNAIAYYTDDFGVELFDTNTGEITEIEEDGNFQGVTISPDGKTVLYSDAKTVYLYRDGKSEKILSRDMMLPVVSVANDGKYIYVADMLDNFSFYCLDADGKKLKKIEGSTMSFFTNKDNTQVGFFLREDIQTLVIYDAAENKTYKYDDVSLNHRTRPLSEYTYDTDYPKLNSQAWSGAMAQVAHYNVDDLTHCLYFGSKTIYETDGKSIDAIAENTTAMKILPDGSVIYLKLGEGYNIYPGTLFIRHSDGEKDKIADDVCGFGVSDSGNSIYYFTEDEKLFLYRNGKSTEIADDVCVQNYADGLAYVGVGVPTILNEDVIVYPGNDEQWYIYKNGKTETLGEEVSVYNRLTASSVYGTEQEIRYTSFNQNSVLFLNDTYLLITEDDDPFIIDASGSIKPLED